MCHREAVTRAQAPKFAAAEMAALSSAAEGMEAAEAAPNSAAAAAEAGVEATQMAGAAAKVETAGVGADAVALPAITTDPIT